jgi:hypothetical protein
MGARRVGEQRKGQTMPDPDTTASTTIASDATVGVAGQGASLESALAAAVMRRIGLPRFTAASGSAASVRIGEIRLENASVDRVDIRNVATTLNTGAISLDDARAIVAVRVFVDWSYDVFFDSGSGSTALGTIEFPFDIGDIDIPRLDNIRLAVPSATLRDIIAAVHPVRDLALGGAALNALRLEDTLLPSAGFALGGLTLGAVNLTDVRLPRSSTARVTLGSFTPAGPLLLPSLRIDGVELPAASAPRVSSAGLVAVPNAVASERTLGGLNFGFLRFDLRIQPTLDIFIAALTIRNLAASATIERVDLRDLRASVDLRNLELERVELEQLHVDRLIV